MHQALCKASSMRAWLVHGPQSGSWRWGVGSWFSKWAAVESVAPGNLLEMKIPGLHPAVLNPHVWDGAQ